MKVNIDRIINDIENISRFNLTPGNGCTRYSYSKEDILAREYIVNEMKKYGFKVSIDNIGNIRGLIEGSDKTLPRVMSGSHIDTVMNGGNYDGILGVVSALEVGRILVENNINHTRGYEVIVFVEEEGSNFGVNLLGSKALNGDVDIDLLKSIKNEENISMYEMIKNIGLNPDKVSNCNLNKDEIDCMIELHIEQANMLDNEDIPVGIVKGINGLKWYEIVIDGESNHAGATSMKYRKDPMVAAAKIISKLPSIMKVLGDDSTVATVGQIHCIPNLTNVIPKQVRFTIDARTINPYISELILNEINIQLNEAREEGYECSLKLMTEAKEILCSDRLINIIKSQAEEKNIDYKMMYSGANHDSSIMANMIDVAMIFVPSVNGDSHCKEEFTKIQDIQKGCDVLLGSICELIK